MSTKLLIAPLLIGLAFAALTLLFIGRSGPDGADLIIILLIPGQIFGMVAHSPYDNGTWEAVFGNFVFYFALTYVVAKVWQRNAHKRDEPEN